MNRATARTTLGTAGVLVLLAAALTASAPGIVRISRGDTLSGIARSHHTTLRALLDLNHLAGNATIYPGQLVRIPVPPPVVRTYVVQRGDNLTTVSRRLHTTTTDLRTRNSLRSSTIRIGQRLAYLGAAAAPSPAAAARPAATPVSRSAASHRAVLAARAVPSKASIRTMIINTSRRHGVDPALSLAVAYQESGFQQRVVSPVDAVGVMQVLPSTARSLGAAHGRRYDVLSTSDNIEAGVVLLKDLLSATGSWQGAMAGYYQGLGSVHNQGLLPQTHAYIANVGYLRARFR